MMNAFDELFYSLEVKPYQDILKEFDYEESKKISEYSWRLPKKKSWRTDDFLGFLSKQKHRQDMAV